MRNEPCISDVSAVAQATHSEPVRLAWLSTDVSASAAPEIVDTGAAREEACDIALRRGLSTSASRSEEDEADDESTRGRALLIPYSETTVGQAME